jgi:hypothetical protein
MRWKNELTIVPSNFDLHDVNKGTNAKGKRGMYSLVPDVQIMALDVTVKFLSMRLLQERHTSSSIMSTKEYVKQHTSSNSVNNVCVCDTFWEIRQQKGTLREFVILWPGKSSLRIIVSTPSFVKAIGRSILHICEVIVDFGNLS